MGIKTIIFGEEQPSDEKYQISIVMETRSFGEEPTRLFLCSDYITLKKRDVLIERLRWILGREHGK